VAVDNDFQNAYSYCDFKKFGPVEDFEACAVSGPKESRQNPTDGIGIYLNYKQVAFVKSRAEALNILEKLISDCPAAARTDFERYRSVLLKSLI
jgi:hypothetical protein